jgi:branched-chain amino acid transport system permease protein
MKMIVAALLMAAVLILPLILPSPFYVGIATQILIYGLFAISVNVIAGYGGMVSLGHAAFLGIAAYAFALLTTVSGLSPFPAIIASLALTTATAALFGLIALRTTGLGFLMITLALGQIVWGVAFRFVDLTNGDNGISLPRSSAGAAAVGPTVLFYVCLATLFATMSLLALLMRSPFGASIEGVRDQPRRMRTLGYDVWLIRYVTYVISGFVAGVAGILYIYLFRFISPHALSLTVSSEAVLMVIAGGIGTAFGPLLGAAVVVLLKNVASAYTDRWPTLLGIIFLFIIVAVPEGLVPGLRRLGAKASAMLRTRATMSSSRIVRPDTKGAR